MITLVEFYPAYGLPNPSPFCLKVETWLRMAELPYTPKYESNPRKGPKGKFPYLHDGNEVVSDSSVIIEYLTKKYDIKLDEGLTGEQLGLSHAAKILMEDHLYWAIVYSRWIDTDYWPITKKNFFATLPPGVKQILPIAAQNQVKRDLHGQGLGRHSKQDIYRFAEQDINALAYLLGEKSFFLGEKPTSIDAVAYGSLANIWVPPLDTPLKKAMGKHPNLVKFVQRMKEKYWYV